MWYSLAMGKHTNLSAVSDEDLYAELGRRRAALRSTDYSNVGRPATCNCGQCATCKKRAAMKKYREKVAQKT